MPPEHKQPVPEQGEASGVTGYRVVVEVALHDRFQPLAGLDQGIVHSLAELRLDALELGPQALADRLASNCKPSQAVLPTDVGKAQEIERLGFPFSEVGVMSGAPYGYRYIRKTDETPAAYVIDEAEARVVRRVYQMYTIEGLSIGEITRQLNSEGVPARRASRWERSVVWGVLRNPAYRGVACFGKTRISARTRVMRPQRRRGTTTPSTTAGHQRPQEE